MNAMSTNVFRNPNLAVAPRSDTAFAVAGALAAAGTLASVVIWGMHLLAFSPGVPEYSKAVTASNPQSAAQTTAGRDALVQLFGTGTPLPTAGLREIEGVQLLGIVADRAGAGVALFSVDGAPPVRVRLGGRVREGVVLTEIQRRQVVLAQGGRTVELGLAVRPRGSTAAAPANPAGAVVAPPAR